MKRARGIDISQHQKTFTDPGHLDFIIVKASEGWAADPLFSSYLPNICSIPVRGAYHYYRTETDPILQAQNFMGAVRGKGFHFLAVDYESRNNTLDKAGAEGLMKCLKHIRQYQPLPVFIYTGAYIYRDKIRVWDQEIDTFPLWLGRWNYHDSAVADPTTALAGGDLGRSWDFWQYTSTGVGASCGVGSTNVDMDVYNGTAEELISRFIVKDDNEMDAKKWYQSKTLWFAILWGLVQLAGIFGFAEFVPGDQVAQYVNLIVSVVVALLRVFTKQPVKL